MPAFGIPEPVEKTLNFPWHLAKGVAHLAAVPVRMLLNDQDVPDTGKIKDGDVTVYDCVSPMLDNASIIYYYTELRSETTKRLKRFGKEKGLVEHDLDVIRNAVNKKNSALEVLKKGGDSSPFDFEASVYRESLNQLEELQGRYKLTDGDVTVFETYFGILKEPKNMVEIKSDIELYNKYISAAFRFSFGGKDFNLGSIIRAIERDPTMKIHEIDDDFVNKSITVNPSEVLKQLESELVYTISISEASKRITVTFRGSVNLNDWMTNLNARGWLGGLVDFKLPGYTTDIHPGKDFRKSYGRVHEGFYAYLFGETQKGGNGSNKSKAEEIMGTLRGLFEKEEYKGFSLFVTGHSLGGALSTLFAFRAAVKGELPTIVTNVSFASPYCGDQGFRDEFYKLEQANLIRHIRVSNDEDVVTIIPPVAPGIPGFNLGPIRELETYKHTGVNVHLYSEGQIFMPKVRVFYPKIGSWPNEIRNAALSSIPYGLSVGMITKHLCPEYSRRLKAAQGELKSVSVEGLYSDTHLTGWSAYTRPKN